MLERVMVSLVIGIFFGNFLPILGDIIENILINHNPFINGLLTPFRPYTLI